jgi:predicted SAM-dependent methyltransferase
MNSRLNLGCGKKLIPGWVNCDFHSGETGVVSHDLRQPLPFPGETFDFVYHSHVLEHLRPKQAENLLQECLRVLRPGGILRVVIPDLEQRASIYLQCLDEACSEESPEALARHEWMTMELVDQLVREESGGEMVDFILSRRASAFAKARIGDEYDNVLTHAATQQPSEIRKRTPSIRSWPRRVAHRWAMRFLDVSEDDLKASAFARLGERHKWMYDRLSLSRMLGRCGFVQLQQVDAFSSGKSDWDSDGLWLDVEQGVPRKPDSIYFEALKA